MNITTAEIPYNPQGVGITHPLAGTQIECRAGQVTVGDLVYDVSALTVDVRQATPFSETVIWLVVDDTNTARYHVLDWVPGEPPPGNPNDLGFTSIVQLALVKLDNGETLDTARGQIVDIEPMIERRHVPRQHPESGELLFDVWKRVDHEIEEDKMRRKYKNQPGPFIFEPLTEQADEPVT